MLVFVLEAGVGALARLYEEQVSPELKMNLNRTFLENYSVRSRETAAIDQMQIEVSSARGTRGTRIARAGIIEANQFPQRGTGTIRLLPFRCLQLARTTVPRSPLELRRGHDRSILANVPRTNEIVLRKGERKRRRGRRLFAGQAYRTSFLTFFSFLFFYFSSVSFDTEGEERR